MAENNPGKIAVEYERKLYAIQKKMAKDIQGLYDALINEIVGMASAQKMPLGVFTLEKLPGLNARIDRLIETLNSRILQITHNGINDAWELSNVKNNLIADIRLAGSEIPDAKKVTFYNPNAKALESFQNRKVAGLDLSQRIYKQGQNFKAGLEAGIGQGISTGQSAAEMGTALKQYLKNPNRLFRRVRDKNGKLRLSKNAKALHPGTGVYRSATKNIQRLTRTETNMAYRSADMARYAQTPFILGYEVKLSASHPRYDICDNLKGKYPIGFQFFGWHPHCLCFCVPILMDREQFLQYQRLVLSGEDSPAAVAKIADRPMTIPPGASEWIDKNVDRVAGLSKPPLWWQKNPGYVPSLKGK